MQICPKPRRGWKSQISLIQCELCSPRKSKGRAKQGLLDGKTNTPTTQFNRWMKRRFLSFLRNAGFTGFTAFPRYFRCFLKLFGAFLGIVNSEVCPQHPPQCVKHCHTVIGKGLSLERKVCLANLANSGPLAKSNRNELSPNDPSKPGLCSSPSHPVKQGLEPTGNVYQQTESQN